MNIIFAKQPDLKTQEKIKLAINSQIRFNFPAEIPIKMQDLCVAVVTDVYKSFPFLAFTLHLDFSHVPQKCLLSNTTFSLELLHFMSIAVFLYEGNEQYIISMLHAIDFACTDMDILIKDMKDEVKYIIATTSITEKQYNEMRHGFQRIQEILFKTYLELSYDAFIAIGI